MRLLYLPFSIVAGLLGARLGRHAFQSVWGRVADSPELPSPRSGHHNLAQVAGAAALQAAMVSSAVAVSEQLSARVFHHLFGVWPEKSHDADG